MSNWLNYHHLYYFWHVAKTGSVTAACQELRLQQPTVSAQLRSLESALGYSLFERRGRRLVLTEAGKVAQRYAEKIFSLGEELKQSVALPEGVQIQRIAIGIVDVIPKLIAFRLLEPLLADPSVRLVCREDDPEQLYTELALNRIDAIIGEGGGSVGAKIHSFNHALGRSTISFFARPKLAKRLKRHFPESLNGTPMLYPSENAHLRKQIFSWLELRGLTCPMVAEFQDSALLKIFAQHRDFLFAAPTCIRQEISKQYHVELVGECRDLTEEYILTTSQRRVLHPLVQLLANHARENLFKKRAASSQRFPR